MTAPEVPRALFVCDGATAPTDLRDEAWTMSGRISTQNDDPEFRLVLEGLARKVVGRVLPRARDLIRIGACCYAADLRLPRGGIDVHRARWRRDFTLCITVDEPAFWNRAEVSAQLEETLNFVTEDRWRFHFQGGPPEERDLRIVFAEEPSRRRPDTVVLFSGGSDSLCALVGALREEGREPVVASHWPARHIQAHQKDLLRAVEGRFGHWDMPHAAFEIHRTGKEPVESSQRTRGFLYACLGAAIAAQHDVTEVRLADNGYVSVNPPISDQLVGALASRGTHPKFLQLVNRLLASVFPGGIRVINPLWNKTRAEALGSLAAAGCADLLALTYTCGKQQGHAPGKPLCGGCSQCVDRRVAAIAAGLEWYDPLTRYELDLFAEALPEGEARTIGVAFVRFASELAQLTPDQLWDRLEELDACVDPDDPEYKKRAAGIPAMLIRHAQETMGVIADMTARAKRDGSYDRLPATALLRLWPAEPASRPRLPGAIGYGVEVINYASSLIRAGATWILQFRDEKGYVPNWSGMIQLSHLLENPRQSLDVIELDAFRARVVDKTVTKEDLRAGYGGDLGDQLTPGAEKLLKNYQNQIPIWIEQAKAAGDPERINQLHEEDDLITKRLRAARDIRGQRRKIGGPEEQARKNISKNIRKCYRRLAGTTPQFVTHAERFVHLSIPPTYDPDPPERWTVQR